MTTDPSPEYIAAYTAAYVARIQEGWTPPLDDRVTLGLTHDVLARLRVREADILTA